jgi:hypothetical protein
MTCFLKIKPFSKYEYKCRRWSKLFFVLQAGDVDVLQHTLAKYVLELAQLEYELAHLTPSLLAASSLYLALILLRQGKPSDPAGV